MVPFEHKLYFKRVNVPNMTSQNQLPSNKIKADSKFRQFFQSQKPRKISLYIKSRKSGAF